MRISDWSSDVCSSDLYTGGGTNTVGNLGAEGLAYSAGVGDKLTGTGTADPNVVNVVLNSDAGLKGVKLEGSEAFVQRVEADLEMLRASPNGQQMLAEFEIGRAHVRTPVTKAHLGCRLLIATTRTHTKLHT